MTARTAVRNTRALAFCRGLPAAFALLGVAWPAAGQDADGVLARVRESVRYGALAGMETGLTASGSASYLGTEAEYALLFHADGRVLSRVSGPLARTEGYDGRTAWETDENGLTRPLLLGDRDAMLLTSWFMTGAWLHGDAPLEFTVDEGASDDRSVALTFELTGSPLSGTVRVRRDTWRPESLTFEAPPSTQTVTILEWDEHAGVPLPARCTHETSEGVTNTYMISSAGPAPVFVRDPYAPPTFAPPADTRFEPGVPAGVEVRRAPTGHLLVRPRVDGEEVGWFIFDTGAGAHVICPPVADRLGLEPFGSVAAVGVGGSVQAPFYRAASLALGPVTTDAPLFIGIDLSMLNGFFGVEIGGIVGYPLMGRVVAEIDMADGAVSLHDPGGYVLPAGAAWEELLIYGRHPCVRVRYEGHEGVFRLDTGAAGSTVAFHAPAVERLRLLEGRTLGPARLGGVGGFVEARSGTLEWFELGGRRLESVEVAFATGRVGAFADAYTDGNIGGDLMLPFRLVFDYAGRRMAFVPRDAGAAPAPAPGP